MEKYSFFEIRDMFYKFNEENNISSKSTSDKKLVAAAVLAPHVFKKELRDSMTEDDRTYIFSTNNKMFLPNMCGSSCFSYEKTDKFDCIRLDYLNYREDIEYCYLVN